MSTTALDSCNAPSKPRFALEIAVVGNRKLNNLAPQVEMACTLIWSLLAEEMLVLPEREFQVPSEQHGEASRTKKLRDFFNEQKPCLTLMSALAKGVDQTAAETFYAVREKFPGLCMEVDSAMPFREQDYPGMPGATRTGEFTDDEAGTLRRLSEQARQVVRLDGNYQHPRKRVKAYRQAVTMMVQNADMLVAVFDPKAPPGLAGTQESVRHALQAEMPVLAVLLSEQSDEPAIMLWDSIDEFDNVLNALNDQQAPSLIETEWRQQVRNKLAYLTLPPHVPEKDKTTSEHEAHLRDARLRESVERLEMFFGERPLPHTLNHRLIGKLLHSRVWLSLKELGRRAKNKEHGFLNPKHGVPQPPNRSHALDIDPYAAYARRADEITTGLMRVYRAAFVLTFILAGVAVTLAVLMLMSLVLTDGHAKIEALACFALPEIVIIGLLMRIEHVAHHERWQQHAVDYRFFAELARPMPWLAPLAASTPMVGLPAFYRPLDPRQSWEFWLLRALARSTPSWMLPGQHFAAAPPRETQMTNRSTRQALRRSVLFWLAGQRRYHRKNAAEMHHIENGLENLAKWLLRTVLAFALVALAIKVCHHPTSWLWELFNRDHSGTVECRSEEGHISVSTIIALLLGAGCACIPALIASLNGIMFQSEARRLELRSESMYHALSDLRRELITRYVALRKQPLEGDTSTAAWDTAESLRSIAALTIAEAGDWKALYQMHNVRAG